jgi:hypothetical protein
MSVGFASFSVSRHVSQVTGSAIEGIRFERIGRRSTPP